MCIARSLVDSRRPRRTIAARSYRSIPPPCHRSNLTSDATNLRKKQLFSFGCHSTFSSGPVVTSDPSSHILPEIGVFVTRNPERKTGWVCDRIVAAGIPQCGRQSVRRVLVRASRENASRRHYQQPAGRTAPSTFSLAVHSARPACSPLRHARSPRQHRSARRAGAAFRSAGRADCR
jgi:hypothetical protein